MEFIIHCNQLCTALKLVNIAASCFQHASSMASGMKIALMFALMAAMAMAVQAGNHTVSCTNNYCKPITVNNVTIGAGLTLDVVVDDYLGILTCVATDILGKTFTITCGCPSVVSAVEVVEILLGLGLEIKVTLLTATSLLGSILGLLNLNVTLCL